MGSLQNQTCTCALEIHRKLQGCTETYYRAVAKSVGDLLKVLLQGELGTVAAVFSEENKAGEYAECYRIDVRYPL